MLTPLSPSAVSNQLQHQRPAGPKSPAAAAQPVQPTPTTAMQPTATTAASAAGLGATPAEIACAILGFCGWRERRALAALSRHWRDTVFGDDGSWKSMCSFLHREECVYSGPVCVSSSWRALFEELWPLRSRWVAASAQPVDKVVYTVAEKLRRERAGETGLTVEPAWKKPAEDYSFNIGVVVRLRPLRAGGEPGAAVEGAKEVVLPLHQRIARIRQQRGCSKEEAFGALFGASGADFFEGASLSESEQAAAARPTTAAAEPAAKLGSEPANTIAGVVSVDSREIVMCAPGVGLRPFVCFDAVLTESASQAAVYETVARRQVADFINGQNCTIFCYGQTGSGKTHTLFGKDTATATTLSRISAEAGVVPRACAEIVAAVEQRQRFMDDCTLQLSYVEVYGEEVSDLLKGDKKSVGAWRGTAVRAVLDGTTRVMVDSKERMQELLLAGEGAKRRAATAMNERSSRAHALLILTLTQTTGSVEAVSHLCLADLGGSEQLSKSGATGVRAQEAIGINTGLLALKQCIRALNNKARHVQYHDSKLTELLSSALGGNSKTTVVVTASSEPRHALESLQALRFGEACAVVQNAASAQQSSVAHLIADLDAKIVSTEALIEKNERWERWEEEMPMDEFGDGGGIRTRMKLVGAQKERVLLEGYLRKRRALLGEPEPDEAELAGKPLADAEANAAVAEPVAEPVPLLEGGSAADMAVANEVTHETKAETKAEKKARVMKSRMENAQKVKEERRALMLVKAAEKEVRAAKRKEELLAAKKEKAKKQSERLVRQMEATRRARSQSNGFIEAELSSVEAQLATSIQQGGTESEQSVGLAAKAEGLRQSIKKYRSRTEKVAGVERRATASEELEVFSRRALLSSDSQTAPTMDGWQTELAAVAAAAPALSEAERELIDQHRQARALVSDSQVVSERSPAPDHEPALNSRTADQGTYMEIPAAGRRGVAGAVATGWKAMKALEGLKSNDNAILRDGPMPDIGE